MRQVVQHRAEAGEVGRRARAFVVRHLDQRVVAQQVLELLVRACTLQSTGLKAMVTIGNLDLELRPLKVNHTAWFFDRVAPS